MFTDCINMYKVQRHRVEELMALRNFPKWKDLADALNEDTRQLKRWVDNETEVKAVDIARLADLLDTSVDYLLGRANTMEAKTHGLTDDEVALLSAAHSADPDEAMEMLLRFRRSNRQ